MSTVEDQTCNLTKQKLSNNNKLNTLVKYQSTKKKKKKRQNKKKPFFNLTTEGNFHHLFPSQTQNIHWFNLPLHYTKKKKHRIWTS